MTPSNPTDDELPASLAARRFAQALAWTDLLGHTFRVEATSAGPLEELVALEAGLNAALAARAPFCEMLWAGRASGLESGGVQLAAFDEAGRLLLRRRYLAGSGRRG
ncbi:hypothetical protein GVN21_00360 [Caulobacter sp. SLTY]|uniref:hypothetical protein n=1 Tax=Caulobacter sp. SLTY TaxID=2683262 RepID=UPI001411B545|nr:hypothetical protein [Caulobacter sp. SLTY]NBB13803.1 hypothetical protein [Caulobacter sp. SLTY]